MHNIAISTSLCSYPTPDTVSCNLHLRNGIDTVINSFHKPNATL